MEKIKAAVVGYGNIGKYVLGHNSYHLPLRL